MLALLNSLNANNLPFFQLILMILVSKFIVHRALFDKTYLSLGLLSPLSNSYTMGCPPVRGDNPRALASGLSYVQVDKHGITIVYHLHQCRSCTSSDISC